MTEPKITITEYETQSALIRLEQSVKRRIEKHGANPHHSAHESLGICQEELYEVMKCIHENQDPIVTAKEFRDLAVAALWAYLSLEVKR